MRPVLLYVFLIFCFLFPISIVYTHLVFCISFTLLCSSASKPEQDMEPLPTISTTTRRSLFVQKLTLTLVLLFLILMAVITIAWLVLSPHEPNFRVTTLSVSNFSVSDSELRGTYDMGFTISNPNKKIEIWVEDLNVVVFYDWMALPGVKVPAGVKRQSIQVGKMGEKDVTVEIRVSKESRNSREKKVFGKVGEEWRKGVVNFNVSLMEVRIRYEAGNWPPRLTVLDVYCGDLDVRFFSPKRTGKLLGVGKDCYL